MPKKFSFDYWPGPELHDVLMSGRVFEKSGVESVRDSMLLGKEVVCTNKSGQLKDLGLSSKCEDRVHINGNQVLHCLLPHYVLIATPTTTNSSPATIHLPRLCPLASCMSLLLVTPRR